VRIGFVMHVMQVAGAELLVSEIIRRLGARIEPVIFCLDAVGALGEQLQKEGVEVVALDRKPGFDLGVARRLAREARSRRIELLHAHQYTPAFYSALARLCGLPRVPIVFTEHGRHYPDVVSWKRRTINRLFLQRFWTRTTAVCEFSRRALIEKDGLSPRRVVVVPNGIRLEGFAARPGLLRPDPQGAEQRALRARLGWDPDRPCVLCVARFHPVKDHPTLLRGFALARNHRPDAMLLLAGDGPERSRLEALAAELGISHAVTFLGVRRDVSEIMRASDVVALTSVSEASSLTLMEAMATGSAILATAVGGNPEIVRDGEEGLLVPRGDHEAVGAALARLLDDPPLRARLGNAGLRRVHEQFDLNQTVDKYAALFEEVLSRSARHAPEAAAPNAR